MAGGKEFPGKKNRAGHRRRPRLLAERGIGIDDGAEFGNAAADDVRDATAAAWSAKRIACGLAKCLPDVPAGNAEDGLVAIWF